MASYVVNGGRRLLGQVGIGGCKNAVLPILAATVATGRRSVIHNCPDISDTHVSIEILRHLGCDVVYDGAVMLVDASGTGERVLPEKYVQMMRSSVLFAGAVLGRFGRFETAFPGGCMLGARPIDLHLKAFELMGARFDGDENTISASAKKLEGRRISLDFPSVGATQNIILAAVNAHGRTLINNAAKEPEIADLQGFLRAAGARVHGAGSTTIVIEGGEKLHDVEYKIMPDRIVASTYLVAGAITRGHVRLNNVNVGDIMPVMNSLTQAGATLYTEGPSVILRMDDRPCAIPKITTAPHPNFPTDVQPQFTALLATAKGDSVIEEKLFEARDAHIDELVKMGANIKNIKGNRFEISGVEELQAADVVAKDLRGGAALILAALAAKGQSSIDGADYVKRGYEAIDKDLQALGADIEFA